MKVGVTGGNGFIGTYVCEELVARGNEPVVFDHRSRTHDPGWEVMLGDIRDATAMVELAAHCDGIIHLAAVLGTQETIQNPRPAAETNMIGGLNFLEAVAQHDLPGVYICVGNHWMNNSYSISKTAVERFVRMFNADRGTRVNNVRVVNAYGPRQLAAAPFGSGKVRKITPAVVCRALSGMPVELYGGGNQISDMVWVGDVARGLVSALEIAAQGKILDHVVEDLALRRDLQGRNQSAGHVAHPDHVGYLVAAAVQLDRHAGQCPADHRGRDLADLAGAERRRGQLPRAVGIHDANIVDPGAAVRVEHPDEALHRRLGDRVAVVHPVVANADVHAGQVVLGDGLEEVQATDHVGLGRGPRVLNGFLGPEDGCQVDDAVAVRG